MASANQYDRQNDAELGSGIFDKTAKVEKPLPRCACGNLIENPWYGDIDCYECQRELKAEYRRVYPVLEEAVMTLREAVALSYMEAIGTLDPLATAGDWAADTWEQQCNDSGHGDFGPM